MIMRNDGDSDDENADDCDHDYNRGDHVDDYADKDDNAEIIIMMTLIVIMIMTIPVITMTTATTVH